MLARTQTSHCIHNNLSLNIISLIEITESAMQSIGFALHNTLCTSVFLYSLDIVFITRFRSIK